MTNHKALKHLVDEKQKILSVLSEFGIGDLCDFYAQKRLSQSVTIENGQVKNIGTSSSAGSSVQLFAGESVAMAHCAELDSDRIADLLRAASTIHRYHTTNKYAALEHRSPVAITTATGAVELPLTLIQTLQGLHARVAELEPLMVKTVVQWVSDDEQVLIAASDGTWAEDDRPLVRLSLQVILKQNGRQETGSATWGGRVSADRFDAAALDQLINEALRRASVNLQARDAPAGMLPVVVGNGWPGVLLHEAIGHGLEADFIHQRTSVFHDRLGKQVASKACTIVDDGTLMGHRGSVRVDDEGTPGQCTTLVENGKLVNFMFDKRAARLMGKQPTGNGRRQSYRHVTIPRMTNTYMLPGEHAPDELIASLDRGVFAANFGGGQVDVTSGKFTFSAVEAYWVEKGKILYPIKGATLIGDGGSVLSKISLVANDAYVDPSTGMCGKDGQKVPVCVGQPTLKIDELLVGGTQSV